MPLSELGQKWNPRQRLGAAAAGTLALLALFWLALRPPGFQSLPDLQAYDDVDAMKQRFYAYLLPIVEANNQRILQQRQRLQTIADTLAAGGEPSWLDRRWLGKLAREYELDEPDNSGNQQQSPVERVDTLLRRVDIVPPGLALAQAAKESGWGRSRFALQGNNLFGQWCYDPGCGLVPENRGADASHEVARFESVSESIRRYMNNLNTHRRYRALRDLRASLREQGRPITGPAIAPGLVSYSERREAYVSEVVDMMQQNRSLLEQVREI